MPGSHAGRSSRYTYNNHCRLVNEQWRARGSWMPGANEVLGCPGPTKFLDARGQRGSWMSGANEVLGCPGQGKSLFFVLKKIYVLRK